MFLSVSECLAVGRHIYLYVDLPTESVFFLLIFSLRLSVHLGHAYPFVAILEVLMDICMKDFVQ